MNHRLKITSMAILLILLIFVNGFTLINIRANDIEIEFNKGISAGILLNDNPLDEVSGLIASRKNQNVLWVHEDDWGPYIYAISINGTILGRYQVGIDGYDVEDIAIGPGPNDAVDYLYIGHIGDNNAKRSTIYIRRVPEPIVNYKQMYDEFNLTNYDTMLLQYPDGAKDAETLMVDTNGDIYIVSKRLSSNKVYCAIYPQSILEINTLDLITTLPEKSEFKWITAGDISPNGEWIILRNDQDNDFASIWYRAPGTEIKKIFSNNHTVIDINDEPLGESICYDSDSSGFYTVSEHAGLESVPIWYYQLSSQQITNQKNNNSFEWMIIISGFIMIILFVVFIFTKNTMVHNVIFIIFIIFAVCIYASTHFFEKEAIKIDTIKIPENETQGNVLTIMFNSTSYNYTLSELQSSFQNISGYGAKINQIGEVSQLDKYTGIPVYLLINLFDDISDSYYVIASASDYEYNFSKENISGVIQIFNQTDESYAIGNCTMIIAFKINDEFIDDEDGGPLRIAFIDNRGVITSSRMWVSSVNKIFIKNMENNQTNKNNVLPEISINVSTTKGYCPLTVDFLANVYDPDGYIKSYYWDFDDGSFNITKNCQHTYTTTGLYNVSLTVTDNYGGSSTDTIEILVTPFLENGYISPINYFDPEGDWDNPSYAIDGKLDTKAQCTKRGFWRWRWTGFLEFQVNESLRYDKLRFNAWYHPRWCNEIDIDIFDNNKWIDIYQGVYKDKKWEIIEFTLNDFSKVRVRFHIRQAFRGIDADLYELEVYRKIHNKPPIADFEYTPSNPKREVQVNFKDLSNDPDGVIEIWNWDFGDGTKSTEENPIHIYKSLGSYNISLKITDNEGATSFIYKKITVGNQLPDVDFSYTPINPITENIIYFSDKSVDCDGYISSWSWNFGDGNTSTDRNPTHKYSQNGTYQIKLTVKDNDGDYSEKIKKIYVKPPPKDWNITLLGISSMIVNRTKFESWVDQYHTCWSDGNHTWCGVPLWMVVAIVDDPEPEDHLFNDTLAAEGYTIKITAGDGWITELNISLVAYNDEGYIIANTIDGEVLPDYTPSGHPSWPLHLRGSDIFPPNNIGNIISIELVIHKNDN